ncbi:MAG: ABC transporter ATP-binding protein [Thermodesulfobacteriota bacterium]
MEPAQPIAFDKITKSYTSDLRLKKSVALHELSFSVKKGEVFGVVGPNGAGKSTALKILMGLVRPDSGTVTVSGSPAAEPACHAKLGFLPENPCLYERLTIREQLRFAASVARMPAAAVGLRIEQLLQQVDLATAADTPIRNFSKGMTQRAALAYALIHEPEILILDEPMSGLDPLGRKLVVDLIRAYHAKGNTILFSSHILTDVERICDRIGIMNKGRLVATIVPQDLQPVAADSGLPPSTTPLEAYFLRTIRDDHRLHPSATAQQP